MQVIPAIDVLDGKVVRLERGMKESARVYSDEPAAIAEAFVRQGAGMVHVVGLDSAFSGRLKGLDLVRCMAGVAKVQYGGGVRCLEDAQTLIGAGVEKIVVGTAIVRNPVLCRRFCSRFPERMVAALDFAGDGEVGVEGWTSKAQAPESLDGFSAVLVTDVSRDGMLSGPNAGLVARVKTRYGLPVTASGGVSSLEDILALRLAGADAVVVGRALYENKFALSDAIEVAENVG